MNKLMGTKWFTFYTKVRPILSGLFLLAVLESFRLNLAIHKNMVVNTLFRRCSGTICSLHTHRS